MRPRKVGRLTAITAAVERKRRRNRDIRILREAVIATSFAWLRDGEKPAVHRAHAEAVHALRAAMESEEV